MTGATTHILRDFLPRLIGIGLVILGAIITLYILDTKDESRWSKNLETLASQLADSTSNWMQNKTNLADQLAEDPRLLSAFEGQSTTPKSVRRALYEFSYINNLKKIYIFSRKTGTSVAKTATAGQMPAGVRNTLTQVSDEGAIRAIRLVTIENAPHVMSASATRSPTGRILGYVAYLQPLEEAFSGLETPASPLLLGLRLSLFQHGGNEAGSAQMVVNFHQPGPQLKNINTRATEIPLDPSRVETGAFTNELRQHVVAAAAPVPAAPNWSISLEKDARLVGDETHMLRLMIKIFAGILILALLLIPTSGAYSNALRNLVDQATGGALTRHRKEKSKYPQPDIPDINPTDIKPSPATGAQANTQDAPTGSAAARELAENKAKQEAKETEQKKDSKKHTQDYNPSEAVIAYNIRTGVKNQRVKLLYQPVVTTEGQMPVMYEVFSRILDEQGEVMPPNMFLPVAHKEYLLQDIDECVVTMAVDKHIMEGAKDPINVPLAFNIAGGTFESLSFLERLMAATTTNPKLNSHVIFELRSREIIEDRRAMGFIRECRDMGFQFSIDYFGGGPDTIKAAKTLKFDYIKVDGLNYDLKKKEDQKELIRLAKTAQAVKLPLVIEKVEDQRMVDFCKKAGVPYIQGYYTGAPKPVPSMDD